MMERKTGSYGIIDRPEYKELSVPTRLLIQPDRQALLTGIFRFALNCLFFQLSVFHERAGL